jgi:hypothetical protein
MLETEAAIIKSYSTIIEKILNKDFQTSGRAIAAESAGLNDLNDIDPKFTKEIDLYLHIAAYLAADSSEKMRYKNILERYKIRKELFKTPVVIIAGGASLMNGQKTENYHETIRELMHDFKGTIICGGTIAGIPGLVGEVKSELEKQSAINFSLIAYLPRELPAGIIKSTAYDHFYDTASDHFSVVEVLSYWCDLVGSGVCPVDVTLVGIEGGVIASMEYQIALSLGAKVALVANSGRAVDDFLLDKSLNKYPNLLQINDDPFTLRGLLRKSR